MTRINFKRAVVSSLLVLALGCSSLANIVLKDTANLAQLKETYKEYVIEVGENDSPSDIINKREKVVVKAEEVKAGAEKDSAAYFQATLIEFLVDETPTEVDVAKLGNLRDILRSSDFETQPVWFKASVRTVFANYMADHGAVRPALIMYEEIVSSEEVPFNVKVYALFNYTNAVISIYDLNEGEYSATLTRIAEKIEALRDQEPMDFNLFYLEAEIYSQIGNDELACVYASSAKGIGSNNNQLEKAVDFIIETSCTNN